MLRESVNSENCLVLYVRAPGIACLRVGLSLVFQIGGPNDCGQCNRTYND